MVNFTRGLRGERAGKQQRGDCAGSTWGLRGGLRGCTWSTWALRGVYAGGRGVSPGPTARPVF